MWAHYANNHKGMCVEYELLQISEQLKFSPIPVIYTDERVSLNSLISEDLRRYTMKFLSRVLLQNRLNGVTKKNGA